MAHDDELSATLVLAARLPANERDAGVNSLFAFMRWQSGAGPVCPAGEAACLDLGNREFDWRVAAVDVFASFPQLHAERAENPNDRLKRKLERIPFRHATSPGYRMSTRRKISRREGRGRPTVAATYRNHGYSAMRNTSRGLSLSILCREQWGMRKILETAKVLPGEVRGYRVYARGAIHLELCKIQLRALL